MLALLSLGGRGGRVEELFTSGLSRIQILSQALYHYFFHCLCIDIIFLMSYFSKLLKRLPSLSMGSLNSTSSGTRAQCGPTKAAADCRRPALLCCRSSLHAGSQERVSQGTWSRLHKAVMVQRLADCHRDRSSARNQQIKSSPCCLQSR